MMNSILWLVLAGAPTAAQEVSISGVVKLKGEAPRRKPIHIDCKTCAPLYPEGMAREDLLVNREGRVQGSFVYVKAGLEGRKFPTPATAVILDQKGCRYEPHVLGLMTGQTLRLRNSDPHVQCVEALAFSNKGLNHGLPPGQESDKTFANPEVMIKMKDSVKVWRSAWVGVLDHPFFAVTGADGTFAFKDLPPGKYTVAAWQEKCEEATRVVEVKAGTSMAVDFLLDLKKD